MDRRIRKGRKESLSLLWWSLKEEHWLASKIQVSKKLVIEADKEERAEPECWDQQAPTIQAAQPPWDMVGKNRGLPLVTTGLSTAPNMLNSHYCAWLCARTRG